MTYSDPNFDYINQGGGPNDSPDCEEEDKYPPITNIKDQQDYLSAVRECDMDKITPEQFGRLERSVGTKGFNIEYQIVESIIN